MKVSRILRTALSAAAFGVVASGWAGGGAWIDDFEAYALNSAIAGQGGWTEWVGSVDVSGHIKNVPAGNAGAKTLEIVGNPGGTSGAGDDTVQIYSIAGGKWIYKVQTFIPNAATGEGYIILLNQYPAFNWSLQVRLNADTSMGTIDFSMETFPLVKGQWVEFRAEIDITAGQGNVDYYYNGVLVKDNATWTEQVSTGGTLTIQAEDLYGGEPASGGSSGIYYDDNSLTPEAVAVAAVDITRVRGRDLGGVNLASILTSDDVRARIGNLPPPLPTNGDVEAIVGFTLPGRPALLKMTVELRSTGAPGANVPQGIGMKEWPGTYRELGRFPSTGADTVRVVEVSVDADRFQRAADNRAEVMLRSFDRGALLAGWETGYDLVGLMYSGL